MKNLQKLYQECLAELDAIGIEHGNIIDISVNSRAKKRWGLCTRIGDTYSIQISSRLLDDSIDDSATKNTIMHEILHTVKGNVKHGDKWTRMANLVNDCYAIYNIKRTTSSEDKGIEEIVLSEQSNYIFKCSNCGQIIRRTKKSKFVENYKEYHCGKCGNNFERIK